MKRWNQEIDVKCNTNIVYFKIQYKCTVTEHFYSCKSQGN